MSDPVTTNIALTIPNRGADVGTWDVPLNGDFNSIDGFIGGVQTINVSSSPVTLTSPSGSISPSGGPTQSQNAVLKITGTLTSNVQITLPLPGFYIIDTFGLAAAGIANGFNVTLRAVGSGLIIGLPPGNARHVYNDGTNVYHADLQEVGTYADYANSAIPGWITACTVPPFLLCNGSTFNAVTYPILNVILGGNTLPDFRGRAPYYFNGGTGRLTSAGAGIDGNTLFAAGGNNGVNLAANQIPSLTSSGNNAITVQSNTSVQGLGASPTGAGGVTYVSGTQFLVSQGLNSITVTYSNGGQAIVQSTTPGAVSGIRMIRAA